ncbi:MAG: hypothetical protein K2W82_00160 [Candidatus Obscuribacterales bacterium]|nr:hypothetical protein [Candidatus Obscuribacterales bacterium]
MMIIIRSLALTCACLLLISAAARSSQITCFGVLGNSGEQGRYLVKFDQKKASGLGVVYDRFGTVWDRGGQGILNHYALDGRLLGQYPLSGQPTRDDKLSIVGDRLVLLLDHKLFFMDVGEKAGTAPKNTAISARAMSFGRYNAQLLCLSPEQTPFLFDALTVKKKPFNGAKPQQGIVDLEIAPDSTAFYCDNKRQIYAFRGQTALPGFPQKAKGDRWQLIDQYWYLQSSHASILRTNYVFAYDPGVVLGGSSGAFLGHLADNHELDSGQGIAKITDHCFAVSGRSGIIHLLHWQDDKKQFEITHRLGALPYAMGLALDGKGKILCNGGAWDWTADPLSPMTDCQLPKLDQAGQVANLNDEIMLGPIELKGNAIVFCGTQDPTKPFRLQANCKLKTAMCGAVVQKTGAKYRLLLVSTDGQGQAVRLSEEGKSLAEPDEMPLLLNAKGGVWTSLALRSDGLLLAAVDGSVVILSPTKDGWKELNRWSAWGTSGQERFGPRIFIAGDGDKLWVSDRERQRVLVFDALSQKCLAVYGRTDAAGNDLVSFNFPETIAVYHNRAVVFDSANQRLLKLSFE